MRFRGFLILTRDRPIASSCGKGREKDLEGCG